MEQEIDRAWIVSLPKAEVHLHLEGCIEPDLMAAAARRHRSPSTPGTDHADEAWPGRPRITNLIQLLAYLDWSCALIDRSDDLFAIAYGTARRATGSGVRHIDVIVNPTHWPHWQNRLAAMVDALDAGFTAAEDEGLATASLCLSMKRTQSREEALALVDWMLERRHHRVAALSIDGDERAGSHNERFADAFARARHGGLHRCAHAGESSGADGVREAIDILGVERVDHGIRAVEDASLVTELADRSIPLDICPTSNVVLGIVADLPHHPVDDLRRRGVRVSINTDDPMLYGTDVAGELARCAQAFGWGETELVAVARTSIESCFADDSRRQELLRDLDTFTSSGPV
jgi:adenosine deaminase